jgi:tRNA(Ile2) C34 agmatinyltransferase TiaS
MFKKMAYDQLPENKRATTYEEYKPICPECHQPMHNMGKEFKPPKNRNIKAWRKVELRHQEIQHQSMTSPHSWVRDLGHS